MKPELIIFDLNKTLINENSWLKLNQAMGVTADEDADLLERAARGEITDSEAQLELLNLYQQRGDVSRAHIAQILTEYTYKPFACNQFIFDENDELVDIIAPDNDAEAKLEQLKQLAAERNLAMHDCLVVGDGANDLPLFRPLATV